MTRSFRPHTFTGNIAVSCVSDTLGPVREAWTADLDRETVLSMSETFLLDMLVKNTVMKRTAPPGFTGQHQQHLALVNNSGLHSLAGARRWHCLFIHLCPTDASGGSALMMVLEFTLEIVTSHRFRLVDSAATTHVRTNLGLLCSYGDVRLISSTSPCAFGRLDLTHPRKLKGNLISDKHVLQMRPTPQALAFHCVILGDGTEVCCNKEFRLH